MFCSVDWGWWSACNLVIITKTHSTIISPLGRKPKADFRRVTATKLHYAYCAHTVIKNEKWNQMKREREKKTPSAAIHKRANNLCIPPKSILFANSLTHTHTCLPLRSNRYLPNFDRCNNVISYVYGEVRCRKKNERYQAQFSVDVRSNASPIAFNCIRNRPNWDIKSTCDKWNTILIGLKCVYNTVVRKISTRFEFISFFLSSSIKRAIGLARKFLFFSGMHNRRLYQFSCVNWLQC